ncbi:MAG: aldo/keto reductase [Muribaculaceae bacterium]|nr:aldo/keto reductase [Muribaculaceae bacterium]
MEYKEYKDITISRLGFGNMRLPEKDGRIDREKSSAMIDRAMKGGVTYYDTAFMYHHEDSETFLGEVLPSYPRESFYLATKFNIGFNPDYRHVFETQLKKLKTDYFDFYLIHAIGDNTIHPYVEDGSVAYLIEQKEKGRIRNLGFSCHASIESLKWFVEQYDWDFAQIQLNCFDWLFSHTQEEYKILEERNIPIVVMEPVRGGRLSRLVPEAEAMLREAHPDWSLASWMFRFVRSLPQVQVILSGMSTMEQVEDNLRTFDDDNNFTEADRDLLFRAMEMFKSQMQVPCTACRYCTDDCPMGINIPEFLKLYNKYKIDGDFGLKDLLAKVESISPPSECLNCGSCASHCPQSIDIPSIMTEMGEKFY